MINPNTLPTSERLADSARRLMLTSRVKRLGGAISDITTEGNFRISVVAYDDEYPIVKASVDDTGFCTELLGVQTAEMGTLYGGASYEIMGGGKPAISVWARTEGQSSDMRVKLPVSRLDPRPIILPEHIVVVSELTRRIRDYKKSQH